MGVDVSGHMSVCVGVDVCRCVCVQVCMCAGVYVCRCVCVAVCVCVSLWCHIILGLLSACKMSPHVMSMLRIAQLLSACLTVYFGLVSDDQLKEERLSSLYQSLIIFHAVCMPHFLSSVSLAVVCSIRLSSAWYSRETHLPHYPYSVSMTVLFLIF